VVTAATSVWVVGFTVLDTDAAAVDTIPPLVFAATTEAVVLLAAFRNLPVRVEFAAATTLCLSMFKRELADIDLPFFPPIEDDIYTTPILFGGNYF